MRRANLARSLGRSTVYTPAPCDKIIPPRQLVTRLTPQQLRLESAQGRLSNGSNNPKFSKAIEIGRAKTLLA